jgi:hypothetical protein
MASTTCSAGKGDLEIGLTVKEKRGKELFLTHWEYPV